MSLFGNLGLRLCESKHHIFRYLSETRYQMRSRCYSFCCACSVWRRSHNISAQLTVCPPKLGKAMICKKHTKPVNSVSGGFFAAAENSDSCASGVSLSVSNLAQRMATAKEKSMGAISTSSRVFSSPLASDLAEIPRIRVDRTCIVQDLEVPDSPHIWGLPIWQVIERIRIFLRNENIPLENRDQFEKDMTLLLATIRGWIAQLADSARQITAPKNIAPQGKQKQQHVDAFVILLQMAGFAVLPELPEIPEPPSPDALSLGNEIEKTLDPTILQGSTAVEDHIRKKDIRLGSPSYYPYLFIATRGVTVVRHSGLLLPQKFRAIERTCFGWIRSPLSWLLERPFLKIVNVLSIGFGARNADDTSQVPRLNSSVAAMTSSKAPALDHRKTVQRIVPAVKLERTWESLESICLKTFTQEPAHKLMVLMYREVVPDKSTILRERRNAHISQIKESLSQAINPIPPGRKKAEKAEKAAKRARASVLDGFNRPLGATKPVSLVMFADVPWGTTDHFFPSTFVLPATRDLLRIDALTFTGLVSALVTYLRNAENLFVYASLMASALSYCVRVAVGLRQALVSYKGTIASQKVRGLISQQRGCFDSLAELATEEMFVDAACVWLSRELSQGFTARQLQQRIFQGSSLTDETVELWEYWLDHNGFGRLPRDTDLSVSSDRDSNE